MTADEQRIEQGYQAYQAYKEAIAKGFNQERIEVLRMAIEKFLAAPRITLSEAGRARIEGCTDPALLERWFEQALKANKESDIFGE